MHHLKEFYKKKLPFCICTDDKGVFSCSSSDEHFRAMQLLGLGKQEMYLQSVKCIDFIFSDDTIKQVLRTQMEMIKDKTLGIWHFMCKIRENLQFFDKTWDPKEFFQKRLKERLKYLDRP